MRNFRSVMAGVSAIALALASGVARSVKAILPSHSGKDADLVNHPNPARHRRGAKKSSGGSGRGRVKAPKEWKRLFGGLAVPQNYLG